MKKNFQGTYVAWVVMLCLILTPTLQTIAQQNMKGVQQKVFRVKFKEQFVQKLEKSKKKKNSEGHIETGLLSLDKLNKKHKVTSLKRVFRPAGPFEQKHRTHGLHLWYELEIEEGAKTLTAVASFSKMAEAIVAEPVYEKHRGVHAGSARPSSHAAYGILDGAADDPQLNAQWHYNNTGQDGGKAGADIRLQDAWQTETGEPGVIVAVTDGGIDVNHSDLAANMWVNTNEIPGNGLDDDNNGYVDDVHGYNFGDETGPVPADYHGTHVGGTIAAQTNNAVGVAGIAGGNGSGDGVRLMSLSAFGEFSVGGFDESYIYAADNGAVISQNSWGYTSPGAFEQSVLDAIDYFIAEAGYDHQGNPRGPMQGGLVIFAAGNSGSDNQWYPGVYEPVFAVAGTDRHDNRYESSNFGNWIELAAPAVDVYSTLPDESYGTLTGTSMACPHVSGVAALIVSKFAGNIRPQQVWDRLVETTDQVNTLPAGFGSGRLNAYSALQENDGMPPQSITDLVVSEAFQTRLELRWTAPSDPGNGKASSYILRYSTRPITAANFENAQAAAGLPAAAAAGEVQTFAVEGLAPTSTYYFAIRAVDFFGNESGLSNVASGTTENAPVISVSPGSFAVDIDASVNPVVNRSLSISNEGTGATLDFSISANLVSRSQTTLLYPGKGLNTIDLKKYGQGLPAKTPEAKAGKNGRQRVSSAASLANLMDSLYYDSGDISAEDFAGLYMDGPYASAVRFEVAQASFSLTHVRNFLRTESLNNPTIIVEVYQGGTMESASLLLSQSVTLESSNGEFFVIPLEAAQNFVAGDIFWIVTKYPYGITYPQGADWGFEQRPNTFYYSSDGGTSFYASDYLFKVRALSGAGADASWLSLDPATGSINAGSAMDINVRFDAAAIANGHYSLNLLVNSDDPNTPTLSLPATVVVSGHASRLRADKQLLEWGSVFVGGHKTLLLTLKNEGLGILDINNIRATSPAYSSDRSSLSLAPGEETVLEIRFSPGETGNINGSLRLATNDPQQPTVDIMLVGTGTAPPVIEVNPAQVNATLQAGATGTEIIQISNTGHYPLTFSFPEFAAQSLLSDPKVQKNNTSPIKLPVQSGGVKKGRQTANPVGHPVVLGAGTDLEFGYTWIDSETAGGPAFIWEDISTTGTEILENRDDGTQEINLPFDVKFYGESYDVLTINSNGYIGFGYQSGSWYNLSIPDDDEPNNFIAAFWDDLRPYHTSGKVFYKVTSQGLIVQYDAVGNYDGEGTATFQIKLLPNGRIYFYYKDVSTLQAANSATIGVENATGTDGAQVVFNNVYVKDSLAVILIPPATSFITAVSQNRGVVPVNQTVSVTTTLSAHSLMDGTYATTLLIDNNDPLHALLEVPYSLVVLGSPQISVAPESFVFDSLFVGNTQTKNLRIRNTGTKKLQISSISVPEGAFSIGSEGSEGSLSLEPFGETVIEVTFGPTTPGRASAQLLIVSDAAEHESLRIPLSGVGTRPPVISVNPEAIYAETKAGEMVHDTLYITNSGGSRLDYTIAATYWFKPKIHGKNTAEALAAAEKKPTKSQVDQRSGQPVKTGSGTDLQFGYSWKDNLNGGGPIFQWQDIQSTGIYISDRLWDESYADGHTELPLDFDFSFYGTTYSTVNVSANGILFFGTVNGPTFINERIPVNSEVNNLIAGFWDDLEPSWASGTVHYKATAESFVVQYTDLATYIEDDSPGITFQIILYPSGKIKLQYLDVEDATFLSSGTVGIENAEGTDGIEVVFNNTYLRNELAVEFSGPSSGSVAPGQTAEVPIVLDGRALTDGTYTDLARIYSNDPLRPLLEIPIRLDISGMPQISAHPDSLLFGELFVHPDSVFSSSQELVVKNTGTKALQIASVRSSDPSTFWVDEEGPVTLAPNQEISLRVTFTPRQTGNLTKVLIIESNDPDNAESRIPLLGRGIAPPQFKATIPGDTLVVKLRSKEIGTRAITIANKGGSTLYYDATVQYNLDEAPVRPAAVPLARAGNGGNVPLKASTIAPGALLKNNIPPVSKTSGAFTDSIVYEHSEYADLFIGTDSYDVPLSIATKFVSPAAGFTLTHVRNFFQTENVPEPIIMAVYVGGTHPSNSNLVLSQEVVDGDTEGYFQFIELSEPLHFDAGETFWAVFYYPPGMLLPQGINTTSEGVNNTFWYSTNNGGSWNSFDNGLSDWVPKIRAYQGGGMAPGWITLDPANGQLAAGETDQVQVQLDASQVESGYMISLINFFTNDPFTPLVSIPLKAFINRLPDFEAYTDSLKVNENELLKVQLNAYDEDGEVIQYTLQETHQNVTFQSTNAGALISFRPTSGQRGFYTFTVAAVDDMQEKTEISFVVEVVAANHAPVLVKKIKKQHINLKKEDSVILDLSQIFKDADHDPLTFTAMAADPHLLSLAMKGDVLTIKGLKAGNTQVRLTADDGNGGTAHTTFEVKVTGGKKEGKDKRVATASMAEKDMHPITLTNYPNPFSGETTIVYTLEQASHVRLQVLSVLGIPVNILMDGSQTAGSHSHTFDARLLPAGVYLYRLEVANQVITRRMIVK